MCNSKSMKFRLCGFLDLTGLSSPVHLCWAIPIRRSFGKKVDLCDVSQISIMLVNLVKQCKQGRSRETLRDCACDRRQKGMEVTRVGHKQQLQEAEALASVLTRVAIVGGAIYASLTVYRLIRSWKRKRDGQRARSA